MEYQILSSERNSASTEDEKASRDDFRSPNISTSLENSTIAFNSDSSTYVALFASRYFYYLVREYYFKYFKGIQMTMMNTNERLSLFHINQFVFQLGDRKEHILMNQAVQI